MIIRVHIANIAALELATEIQKSGHSASVTEGFGAGQWGLEPTAIAEFAVPDSQELEITHDWLKKLLRLRGETCAYVTMNGNEAFLVYADRDTTPECIG